MAVKTKHVGYRISAETWAALERRAEAVGQSTNGYACSALLEKLHRAHSEEQALALLDEVKSLRADLATATEALLTVVGGSKESGARAAAWVKRHLNRPMR